MRRTLTVAAAADLWLPSFGMRAVTCRLAYTPDDPYAITLHLEHNDGRVTTWTFARSLFADGLAERAGDGDVRFWRVTSSPEPLLAMALTRSGQQVHLYAAIKPLVEFLAATYVNVPAGTEEDHVDIDAAIAGLLGRD